jgi:hypothetical protein
MQCYLAGQIIEALLKGEGEVAVTYFLRYHGGYKSDAGVGVDF